ncbi:precorrin-2 C(20)-methyltransferase [Geminicoccus roseus]|uniref:precorrin-2 C(20)-methyltransferase n=1 Tax=Geminicoccus roseus TaxID=404900 RepID=UPI000402C952|nr:precorrin-2 C(20)-methyltransferase [Geminicoccus roseus]
MTGLFGIGVGPGDPELVTLKAARLIGALPVLAHIGADGRPSRARRIAAGLIRPGVRELSVDMPMRFAPEAARPVYDDLAGRIEAEIAQGHGVGFLCEGDPLLYGSFVAILDRLVGRVPVTIVPGITSIAASAASAGHTLALRDEILAVLPATAPDARLRAALAAADSVAILKVGRHLPRIRLLLEEAGLAGRALVVAEVGRPEQAVRPLHQVAEERLPYFALILTRHPREAR